MAAAVALLPFLLAHSALAGGVDLAHPPRSFCAPVLEVAARTADCTGNGAFLRAARDCLGSLNRLEDSLGASAKAIARKGERSQKGETGTGRVEYAFSSASLAYLIATAETAKREVREYEEYVAPPPVELEPVTSDAAEPLAWAYGVSCFRDAQSGLKDTERSLAGKLDRYAARKKEAEAYEAALGTHKSNFGSLSAPQARGRDTGAAKRPASRAASSDVTGLAQDKQKQKQAP